VPGVVRVRAVRRKHATAHKGTKTPLRVIVRWLSLFIAHLVGRIVSGVRVSASFQTITRLVGRLGSEVCVSVSFQSFALRMFVYPVILLPFRLPYPVPEIKAKAKMCNGRRHVPLCPACANER